MNKSYYQNKAILKRLIGILISIIALFLVARNLKYDDIIRSMQRMNYYYLGIVLLIIMVNFTLRSIRWGNLFESDIKPSFKNLFVSLMIGYLANNVLPARSGELIRVWKLGQTENIPKSTVFGTILIERIVDLFIALLLFRILMFYYPVPLWVDGISYAAIICGLIISTMYLLRNVKLAGIVKILFQVIPSSILNKMERVFQGFVEGIKTFFYGQKNLTFMFFTVLIWLTEFSIAFFLARAFSLALTEGQAIFVMLAIGLGSIIPSSPGSIGTFEYVGMNALSLLGYRGAIAQSYIIVLHGVVFLCSSFIGILCLLLSKQKLSSFKNGEITSNIVDSEL